MARLRVEARPAPLTGQVASPTVRTLLGGLLCLGLVTVLPPARAEDPTDPRVDSGGLVLVLDASGSMAEPVAGSTKIKLARKALRDTVTALPDDARVGMRVFGATVEFANQPGACTDTQNVVPVDTLDRGAMRKAIDAYEPYGETPIGNALKGAGQDLANESGKRTIVLVSDGEPTCAPDPCQVARNLSKQGIDVRIDVVGLDVSGKARQALQCIAAAGGGTYYDADSAGELADSLDQFSSRAFKPFGFTGEPIDGKTLSADYDVVGDDDQDGLFEDVPEIEPGLWLDDVSPNGKPTLYRVPRTEKASTIYVGATTAGEAGINVSSIRAAQFVLDDGEVELCSSENGSAVSLGARHPLVSVSVSTHDRDLEAPCATADEVFMAISALPGSDELVGQPVEIGVYEEPPVDADAGEGPFPVADEVGWTPLRPEKDPVSGVLPGGSLAEAPVLEDGSYQVDINGGETQVFAVPLDWGQRLQAQVDMPINARVRGADTGIESGVKVSLLGPLRDTPDGLNGLSKPDDWTVTAFANLWTDTSVTNYRTGAMSPTLAFGNREATHPSVKTHTLPGLQYVEVNLSLREPLTVPYTLTIARYSDDSVNEPVYVDGWSAPSPDSRLVGPDEEDADEADGGDGDGGKDAAGKDDDGLPGWVIPVVAGVGGLLVLGSGALAVRRRRRRSPS